ncbi:MAG: YchJ family metal-binding protein [Fuerstiella sp.]|jgi:SEC-C motif-containing protein|nr:YchJ family metal-binding protein [Fuerstiella sp.]
MSITEQNCPCGTDRDFADCCGRFLDDGDAPETVEQLMRSRFSAYCLKRIDYLVDSTHPDARSAKLRDEVVETAERVTWNWLKVVSTRSGRADDKVGNVEFIAGYEYEGESGTHHERSQFRRYDGKWKYLDDRG